jgi:hypothetical protein
MGTETVILITFIAWGIPLGWLRSRFRKMVYRTNSWTINIKPVFWKEIQCLAGTLPMENGEQQRIRNSYRIYLVVYTALFILWRVMAAL